MVSESFRKSVESGLGGVVILAGSGRDEKHIDKIAESLLGYKIPFEVRIASAHKQPDKLSKLIGQYDGLNGPLVYIAVAGGTDALSGNLPHHSKRPVISCPPDHLNMSCLNNSSGSSNAYIGRPENAARFVAQMFSMNEKYGRDYAETIHMKNNEKLHGLEEADEKLQRKYADMQKGEKK